MIKLKSLISENERLGRCYELSGRYVSHHSSAILVHGILINPTSNGYKELEHAWVEEGDEIFDPVMDKRWKKEIYEGLFRAKVIRKFSSEEVLKLILRTHNWGPWTDSEINFKKKIKENNEVSSSLRGKTLISVDIQPEYASSISFDIESYTQFLNEQYDDLDRMVFVWNGPDLGMIDETEYKYWLVSNGLNEDVVDKSVWIPKVYAFFRYCMDNGNDHDATVNFVRFMFDNNINDSREMNREMWAKYLRQYRYTDKKEIYDLLKKSDDCVNIPDLMHDLQKYNNIVLTGGGVDECLKEVEIALSALKKNYTVLHDFTY